MGGKEGRMRVNKLEEGQGREGYGRVGWIQMITISTVGTA
jgi:hypothetical protein